MNFKHLLLLLTLLLSACAQNESIKHFPKEDTATKKQINKAAFQAILDSAKVEGTILIYDFQKDHYYSNNFDWADKGQLPASTFKIPNSIIALETGVVENDSTLFKWDGKKRALKNWEQDLIFKDAFQFSCVPCYQDVARRIGEKRMVTYLDKLNFGQMQVDSATIANFWLTGTSRISPFEQLDFLKRLYKSELPISKRTETILKRMLLLKTTDTYKLRGKTGWSIQNNNNNGWFVGYEEREERVLFFATNINPTSQFNMKGFAAIRKEVTYEALKKVK